MTAVEVVRASVVRAPRDEVWARVVTAEGVADEFGPLLTMRFPASLAGASIADLPRGRPIGRAWILLAGVVPVEFDDLVIVELEAPRYFHGARAWARVACGSTVGSSRTCPTAPPG